MGRACIGEKTTAEVQKATERELSMLRSRKVLFLLGEAKRGGSSINVRRGAYQRPSAEARRGSTGVCQHVHGAVGSQQGI